MTLLLLGSEDQMDHPAGSFVPERRRRATAVALACALAATLLWHQPNAGAAIVATVPLGTAANYSVLAGSAVTNTNDTVLHQSVGVWPGTSITGFPPGQVVAPGTIDRTNAAAQQAQADLTAAYNDAAGRPINATTPADLTNLVLPGGVYSGPSKGALLLTGTLVLDGGGDPSTVFIFQTNSTLTTATGSTVRLVNGAQECNVFWQVGSSATLGTGSTFVGNILALTSITVNSSVTVHGRALARNGAVTLDGDVFTSPTCATAGTTTTAAGGATTTTAAGGATTTTAAGGATTTTTVAGGATTTTSTPGGATTTTTVAGATTSTTAAGPGGTTSTLLPGTGGGAGGAGTGGTGAGGAGTGGASATTGRPAATATTRDRSTLPRSGSPADHQALAALALLGLGLIALGQRELARD